MANNLIKDFLKKLKLSLIIIMFSLNAICQDYNAMNELENCKTATEMMSPNFQHHHLAIGFGIESSRSYTKIGTNTMNFYVPVIGLSYSFWIDDGLGFDLKSTIGLSEYNLNNGDKSSLKRKYPFSISAQMLFNPAFGLLFFIGPGVELERHKNLFVFNLGIGYRIIVWKQFDVTPDFFYAFKASTIGVYGINMKLGWRFGN